MKNKLKNKKVVYSIIGIISLLLVGLAVTYAYWLITKNQEGTNVISTGCLDINLQGTNDITLSDQFPMSDEDGMKLKAYEFTVTNNCNTSVDYQIALEAIGEESTSLSSNALKVALNDNSKLYSSYAEVDTTIEGAYEARKLYVGTLNSKNTEGSSASHSLRLWIDENADISEMNKTFQSQITVTVGQGIKKLSPSETVGTLAYDILSNYGGVDAPQKLEHELSAGEYEAPSPKFIYSGDEYYWGTEMIYNNEIGMFELAGEVFLATLGECRNGQKSDGTAINCAYTFYHSYHQASVSNTGFKVVSLTNTKGDSYITAQTIKTYSPFSTATTEDEYGLYATSDDLGTSYYLRGDVENNYVQLGSHKSNIIRARGYYSATSTSYKEYKNLEECNNSETYNYNCTEITYATEGDPMYWRIVRINGDGSVRLIYDGTELVENGTAHISTIGDGVYNLTDGEPKYVGYTYDDGNGTQVDSTVKSTLETWYANNLESDYGIYIADGIFCNDRSSYDNKYIISSYKYTYYYPNLRSRSMVPVLTCTNKNDRYTVEDTTNGNGLLKNPIGLLTLDEAFFAGGTSSSNRTYYLYSGEYFWLLSPRYFNGVLAVGSTVTSDGYAGAVGGAQESFGVRPVINLKADVSFTGQGTIDSPYKIVTE